MASGGKGVEDDEDARVAYEELAARYEYDAGLDRASAEQAAAQELWPGVDPETRALYELIGEIPDGCDVRKRKP